MMLLMTNSAMDCQGLVDMSPNKIFRKGLVIELEDWATDNGNLPS
jgi:hypothetical protein